MPYLVGADPPDGFGHRAATNDANQLEVELQTSRVEVARADDGPLVVDDHHLAVQHHVTAFVDYDPALHQPRVEVTCRPLRERHIAETRHDDPHSHAAPSAESMPSKA